MKKISLFFLFLFIYGCGYNSIYKNHEKQNLQFIVKNMKGDFEINNFINNDLKIASDNKSKNIYELNFETNYEKIILAKDATGKATDYKLEMIVRFIVISNTNYEITFKENFKIKNNSENFEQSNYEKEIKRNFSRIVKEKLILYLLNK